MVDPRPNLNSGAIEPTGVPAAPAAHPLANSVAVGDTQVSASQFGIPPGVVGTPAPTKRSIGPVPAETAHVAPQVTESQTSFSDTAVAAMSDTAVTNTFVPKSNATSQTRAPSASKPAKPSAPGATATEPPAAAPADDVPEKLGIRRALSWFTVLPSWVASLVFHMLLLLLLAMIVQPTVLKQLTEDLVSTNYNTEKVAEPLDDALPELGAEDALDTQPVEGVAEALSTSDLATGMDVTALSDMPAPGGALEVSDIGLGRAPVADLTRGLGGMGSSAFDGRGEAARKTLVAAGGGNEGSENSVALALLWLAHHQLPDGNWNFDHRRGPCQSRCANPGRMDRAEIAATAMALLPFLGAGQTHLQGKYKKNVQAGLTFLVNQIKDGPNGGDLGYEQGNMYGHGLASIALCEAYALSKDKDLVLPCQRAINYIAYAQDPVGGGWRYAPHMPGDTSVVGWQLMALKSAHLGYLNVPPKTIKGATNFLNAMQGDGGSVYGYDRPPASTELKSAAATSAIGLLCRMYLGWKHDEPALERGIAILSAAGPQKQNMYFNYYATQVMHHYEGEPWSKWNSAMRDYLVNSQAKTGHEAGSWYFGGELGADQGGRLYTTALATMTLEVYYRHLPIYQKQSTNEEFDE